MISADNLFDKHRHREEIAGLRGDAEAMTLLDQMKSVGEDA